MGTIAISIDPTTLDRVDRLAASASGGSRGLGPNRPERPNRSALIRVAIQEFLDREERRILEENDRALYHRHRVKLRRQAEALIKEQADT